MRLIEILKEAGISNSERSILSKLCHSSIYEGVVEIPHLRMQIYNIDQTLLLLEKFKDFEHTKTYLIDIKDKMISSASPSGSRIFLDSAVSLNSLINCFNEPSRNTTSLNRGIELTIDYLSERKKLLQNMLDKKAEEHSNNNSGKIPEKRRSEFFSPLKSQSSSKEAKHIPPLSHLEFDKTSSY